MQGIRSNHGVIVVQNGKVIDITVDELTRLQDDCHRAKAEARADAEVNESLHKAFSEVAWDALECATAECWVASYGGTGWRCYIDGPDKHNERLLTVLRDKLRGMGWTDVEVVPA